MYIVYLQNCFLMPPGLRTFVEYTVPLPETEISKFCIYSIIYMLFRYFQQKYA